MPLGPDADGAGVTKVRFQSPRGIGLATPVPRLTPEGATA